MSNMKIIILGAGRVGFTVANNLSHENFDITLIDTDSAVIEKTRERLDIAAICGNATHPDVLESAGAKHADLVIAVTDSDVTNMMACHILHHLFNVPQKVARVRNPAFLDVKEQLFQPDILPIDTIINPEEEIVNFIKKLILHPGAQQVLSFADGALSLVEAKAGTGCSIVGLSLKEMSDTLQGLYARIAAIYRADKPIIPNYNTIVEEGDRLFFIASSADIKQVLRILFNQNNPYKRLIIAGGGRVGLGLAKALEDTLQVKIIAKNNNQAYQLSEELDNTIVLSGDATDENLLLDESIEKTDVFCTVTSDDETNILCSMLAKNLGARVVMSMVDRNAYMSMVDNGSIDNAIYPQHTTIGKILAQVRGSGISQVHSLLRGKAEAFEAIVLDNGQKSDIANKPINAISLPDGSAIIGVVRDGESIPATADLILKGGDHVIMFLSDRSQIQALEALFLPQKSLLNRLIK